MSGIGEKKTEAHITLILLHKTKKTRAVMAVCLLINGLPFPGAGDLGNMKPLADSLPQRFHCLLAYIMLMVLIVIVVLIKRSVPTGLQ